MSQSASPTIDILLNLVPDAPAAVLQHLCKNSSLASRQDAHGYSLLHAAATYNHADLVRALIGEFSVDPDILDEDGETALFSVETVSMAELLLSLGTTRAHRNTEGLTAAEKFRAEEDLPEIGEFLVEGDAQGKVEGERENEGKGEGDDEQEEGGFRRPPPLPEGIKINVGTMSDADAGGEPDPEFRRRIEELASRGDFEGEEGQRELRRLVEEAVSGISGTGEEQGPSTKRRAA